MDISLYACSHFNFVNGIEYDLVNKHSKPKLAGNWTVGLSHGDLVWRGFTVLKKCFQQFQSHASKCLYQSKIQSFISILEETLNYKYMYVTWMYKLNWWMLVPTCTHTHTHTHMYIHVDLEEKNCNLYSVSYI